MLDLAHIDRVTEAFHLLLKDLSATWAVEDIEYIDEEVGHREFDDALENLIALGLRSGPGFTVAQMEQIKCLAEAIGLRESKWLDRLRQQRGLRRNP